MRPPIENRLFKADIVVSNTELSRLEPREFNKMITRRLECAMSECIQLDTPDIDIKRTNGLTPTYGRPSGDACFSVSGAFFTERELNLLKETYKQKGRMEAQGDKSAEFRRGVEVGQRQGKKMALKAFKKVLNLGE